MNGFGGKRNIDGILPSGGGAFGGLSFSIAIAVYVVIAFVFQIAGVLIFGENTLGYTALASTASFFAFIAACVFYSKTVKKKFFHVVGVKRTSPWYFVAAVVIAVGMFFGFGFINTVAVDFLTGLGVKVASPEIPLTDLKSLIVLSIVLAVLPAVAEEAFFRGVLTDAVTDCGLLSVGGLFAFFSAQLLFALYHCSLSQFLYQLLYGAALAFLAYYAKSALPSALAHFLNNFFVLLLSYLKIDISAALFNPFAIVGGLIVLIGVISAVLFIPKLKKQADGDRKSESPVCDAKKNLLRVYLYGSFGILICVLMIVLTAVGG